jgi:hypothetical protein
VILRLDKAESPLGTVEGQETAAPAALLGLCGRGGLIGLYSQGTRNAPKATLFHVFRPLVSDFRPPAPAAFGGSHSHSLNDARHGDMEDGPADQQEEEGGGGDGKSQGKRIKGPADEGGAAGFDEVSDGVDLVDGA